MAPAVPSSTAAPASSTAASNAGATSQPITIPARVADCCQLIEKGVAARDDSLILRALRKSTAVRRDATVKELTHEVKRRLPPSPGLDAIQLVLTAAQQNAMATEDEETKATPPATPLASESATPELEVFLHLLVLGAGRRWRVAPETLFRSASVMLQRAKSYDRRTMDHLAAKAWQVYGLAAERSGADQQEGYLESIMASHRTACLRLDEPGQATTINLALRHMVNRDLVSQAAKFAAKARFPDGASNNQSVRYLYYTGRVEALHLEYAKSISLLLQSIRKTPTHTALAFRCAQYKLAVVVQLLTGELPERKWFSDPEVGPSLEPYLELAKAVRNGSVPAYKTCMEAHEKVFAADKTLTLVVRLRSSVIKRGLRSINASYSRITLTEVASKLGLETGSGAEFVCAKAIRDGVINASIDPATDSLVSKEQMDYSSTSEPQRAFQRRVNFLMDVHNDAVKSLRFHPDAYKAITKELDDEDLPDEEDEEKVAAELAEMEDGDGMDDD